MHKYNAPFLVSRDDISLATMLHGVTNVDVAIEWYI
jgi:hypothetical protein